MSQNFSYEFTPELSLDLVLTKLETIHIDAGISLDKVPYAFAEKNSEAKKQISIAPVL